MTSQTAAIVQVHHPSRHLDRDGGLAHPTDPCHRDQPVAGEVGDDPVDLVFATDDRAEPARDVVRSGNRTIGEIEGRVLEQDLLFELHELASRFDAELLIEGLSDGLEDAQCLGLATGAVQRQHEGGVQTLPQRVLFDLHLDLRDDPVVVPSGETSCEARLSRAQPHLLESPRRTHGEVVVAEVGEGIPARPHGQRLVEYFRPLRERGTTGTIYQLLELDCIHLLGTGQKAVTTGSVADHRLGVCASQDRPEPRDRGLQRAARVGGRLTRPQRVRQFVRRDRPTVVGQQDGEQPPLEWTRERDRFHDAALPLHLEWPQHPEEQHRSGW